MRDIIVLHNTFAAIDDELYLSQSGVLEQVRAVEKSLDMLGLGHQRIEVANIKELAQAMINISGDIVFNLAEEFADDIEQACYVPAICKAFGNSCTGNDTRALLYSQNKAHAKSLLGGADVRCPGGVAIDRGQIELLASLERGRYILKPACCDASEGITGESVVDLPKDNTCAIEQIKQLQLKFGGSVVVEQFIPSRELNVAMMQQGQEVKILAVAEIDFSAFGADMPKIVDYSAKWQSDSFGYNNTPRKIPAALDSLQYEKLCRDSLKAWHALGCRDYARVDFRIDDEGNLFVLEVNPNPDISPDSGFAAALDFAQIPYSEFVMAMLTNAAKRLEMARN